MAFSLSLYLSSLLSYAPYFPDPRGLVKSYSCFEYADYNRIRNVNFHFNTEIEATRVEGVKGSRDLGAYHKLFSSVQHLFAFLIIHFFATKGKKYIYIIHIYIQIHFTFPFPFSIFLYIIKFHPSSHQPLNLISLFFLFLFDPLVQFFVQKRIFFK